MKLFFSSKATAKNFFLSKIIVFLHIVAQYVAGAYRQLSSILHPLLHDLYVFKMLYAYLWLNPMQYYLKAQFGYSKDEFANLLLIAGAAGMLSQVLKLG